MVGSSAKIKEMLAISPGGVARFASATKVTRGKARVHQEQESFATPARKASWQNVYNTPLLRKRNEDAARKDSIHEEEEEEDEEEEEYEERNSVAGLFRQMQQVSDSVMESNFLIKQALAKVQAIEGRTGDLEMQTNNLRAIVQLLTDDRDEIVEEVKAMAVRL